MASQRLTSSARRVGFFLQPQWIVGGLPPLADTDTKRAILPLEAMKKYGRFCSYQIPTGGGGADHKPIMMDVSRRPPRVQMSLRMHLKPHHMASSPCLKKKGHSVLIGPTKGSMKTKLHAVPDSLGRPIAFQIRWQGERLRGRQSFGEQSAY